MAEYYVQSISVCGARDPVFTVQPVGPANFTIGTSAVVNIPFTVIDPNHTDTLTYSVTGSLPASVSASFIAGPVLRLTFPGGGSEVSASIMIIADDGTGPG